MLYNNDAINTIRSQTFEIMNGLQVTDFGAHIIYKALVRYDMDWGDFERVLYIASEKTLSSSSDKFRYILGIIHTAGKEKFEAVVEDGNAK